MAGQVEYGKAFGGMTDPNEQPLVSILMPAYNVETFIAEAINAILAQTYTYWELLILNDGSSDRTEQVIDQFQDRRIKVYQHSENRGYLSTCNELFEKATGQFITFLDADDTCQMNRLEVCLHAFRATPSLDFLTTDHRRCKYSGQSISENRTDVDYSEYAWNPAYTRTICCATVFLRKRLLEKVGGYHPFFDHIGGEDYHWLWRLSISGSGTHLTQPLYSYRMHTTQTHRLNQNPLKFYADDMDREIRSIFLSKKVDLLVSEPEQLKHRWTARVTDNPSDLHFREAAFFVNHGEPWRGMAKAIRALLHAPLAPRSWEQSMRLIHAVLVRAGT